MNKHNQALTILAIAAPIVALNVMTHSLPAEAGANSNWFRVRILKQSDAELVDAGGTSKTITLDPLYASGKPLEISDVYVDMVTAFDRTTDGGPSTFLMDIGKSGATQKYANDIDLQATTDQFGSKTMLWTQILDGGSSQFLPPFVEASGLQPVLTLTSAAANISTNNAGEAHIYVKYGALPKSN